jgi:hypothetical protein
MTNRRSKFRYPISLPVTFRVLHSRISGAGLTLDLSSGGALVAASTFLPVRTRVEISMEWPFSLEGAVPLQLVAQARVTRSTANGFAVAFRQHEFRTVGRRQAA